MIYLADKTGKFLAHEGEARYRALEWLMWQMGGAGPMLGQVHHFLKFNPGKAPYAEERFLQGGPAALRRARQAPRGGAVSGRRVLDCRYRHMAMDLAFRNGSRSTSRPFRTWPAGTPRSPRERQCRRGITCPRKWAISPWCEPGSGYLGTWFVENALRRVFFDSMIQFMIAK